MDVESFIVMMANLWPTAVILIAVVCFHKMMRFYEKYLDENYRYSKIRIQNEENVEHVKFGHSDRKLDL